jgi:tetraacyldisaccharide 4'-kinase
MSTRRPWAKPLVPVYAAVLAAKEALRSLGVPSTRKLAWPVVSVGSLSAGGAGKTPVVIALATILRDSGWGVDVLSRGYGREGRGVERVVAGLGNPVKQVPRVARNDNQKSKSSDNSNGASEGDGDGKDFSAARFGDEPVLIARRTDVPVWVGADRFIAGELAEKDAAEDTRGLHLLDDGFQHRQLARAFDVVLVTAEDLDDKLLPEGNLRERFTALQRADAVVVRAEEVEGVSKRVWPLVREGAQIWTVQRKLRFPAPLFVFGAGLRPVAFCAIARPEGFASMLTEAGCGIVETVAFRDHHAYTMADIDRVIEVAKGMKATGFVSTEKDAVKLTAAMRERLEAFGLLMIVALEAEFVDGQAVLRAIEARL